VTIGRSSGLAYIGRPPWIFQATTVVAIANLFLGLGTGIYFERWRPGIPGYPICRALQNNGIQCHVPTAVCWYAENYTRISLYLLGLLLILLIVYRKNIRMTIGG